MKSTRLIFTLSIVLVIISLAALACNIPRNLATFLNGPRASDMGTAVAVYDATLVSKEGDVVSLPISSGRWSCEDVDGELSLMNSEANMSNKKIKKAELLLYFDYDFTDEWLDPFIYYFQGEIESPIIGKDNQIVDWEISGWKNRGRTYQLAVNENYTFSTTIDVFVENYSSLLASSSYTTEKTFFGKFDSRDYSRAYLCDMGKIGLLDGWYELEDDEFESFCSGYYYECTKE